jgi:hypothetical protein
LSLPVNFCRPAPLCRPELVDWWCDAGVTSDNDERWTTLEEGGVQRVGWGRTAATLEKGGVRQGSWQYFVHTIDRIDGDGPKSPWLWCHKVTKPSLFEP